MKLPEMMFENEKNYAISVYLAEKMLNKNFITKKEYEKICKQISKKYHPVLE